MDRLTELRCDLVEQLESAYDRYDAALASLYYRRDHRTNVSVGMAYEPISIQHEIERIETQLDALAS